MSTYVQAARVATLLAFTGGGVDAIGYLTLAQLFTAHMSGNSDAFGVALGQADVGTLLERGVPIAVFVLGIALGTAMVELEGRRAGRHPFVPLYALETALLALFWLVAGVLAPAGHTSSDAGLPFFVLASLLALPMGLQTATLRRVGRQRIHTTFVTSVLASLAEAAVHSLLPPHGSTPAEARRRLEVLTALWGGYVVGAAAATVATAQWSFGSMSLPLAGLLLVLLIDVRQPHELGADLVC